MIWKIFNSFFSNHLYICRPDCPPVVPRLLNCVLCVYFALKPSFPTIGRQIYPDDSVTAARVSVALLNKLAIYTAGLNTSLCHIDWIKLHVIPWAGLSRLIQLWLCCHCLAHKFDSSPACFEWLAPCCSQECPSRHQDWILHTCQIVEIRYLILKVFNSNQVGSMFEIILQYLISAA